MTETETTTTKKEPTPRQSSTRDPKDADIMANERTPERRTYNVIKAGLPNLEGFLVNGGSIVLGGPSGHQGQETLN